MPQLLGMNGGQAARLRAGSSCVAVRVGSDGLARAAVEDAPRARNSRAMIPSGRPGLADFLMAGFVLVLAA